MPHQILHLLRVLIFFVFDTSVDDTEFTFLLEGMISVVEDEEYATKHPDVNPIIYGILEIEINHFWWAVHQSSILFESFLIMVQFSLGYLLKIYALFTATTKIAELKYSLPSKQNILNFHILMEYA